jgi:hypothetical protein
LSTMTDEFTVARDGKNLVHVAIVDGRFAIGKVGDQTTVQPKSLEAANVSPPPMVDATRDASDDPERRAAEWMRSQSPPLTFVIQSTTDRNKQWYFAPESTEPLPSEPFHVYQLFLTKDYTSKFKDATAEDVAPHIKGLRQLEAFRVSSDEMTSLGVGKLLAIPELHLMKQFEVSGSQFDDQLFVSLSKLPDLTKVHFSFVPGMKGNGISRLAACVNMTSVAWTVATPSVESMEELTKLPNLSVLEINSIKCSEAHAMAIAKLKLRQLFLYESGLDDVMVKHLATLTELESLNISVGQITDAGLSELRVLKKLKSIDVRRTLITAEGVAEFKKAVPDCQVMTDLSQPDA